MQRTKLLKNTSWYMVAALLPSLVNFLMLPVFTRFMTPDDYGLLSLVNSLGAFVQAFMGLRLSAAVVRFYFDYEGVELKRFFSTLFYGVVVINLAILLPLHLFGQPLVGIMFPKADIPYNPYVALAFAAIFLNSLCGYLQMMLRAQERARDVFIAAAVYAVVLLGLSVHFVIVRRMAAQGVLQAQVLSAIVHLVVCLVLTRSSFVVACDRRYLREGLAYGWPLIPHVLGGILFSYSDRLILGAYVPLAAIGLYNISDRIAWLMRMAAVSFGKAYGPVFFRASKEDKAQAAAMTRTVITQWSVAAAMFALGLALFSEELLVFLTPPAFHGAYPYIPVLVSGYVFQGLYIFMIQAIKFEKKTKVVPLITFTSGAFNVVANLLLVPHFGVMAAAWTTLLSFAMIFLLALRLSRRYYALAVDSRALVEIFGTVIAAYFATWLLRGENLWINLAWKAAGFVASGAILLGRNHGDIATVVSQIAERYRPGRTESPPGDDPGGGPGSV